MMAKSVSISAAAGGLRARLLLPPAAAIGFVVEVLAVVAVAAISYQSLQVTAAASQRSTTSLRTEEQLQTLLSTMQDAETGQRGFVLTGEETYLAPYNQASAALTSEFERVRELVADTPEQRQRLDVLQAQAKDKMQELGETIALKRAGKSDEALALVRSNRGKFAMDRLRAGLAEMLRVEHDRYTELQAEWRRAAGTSLLSTSVSAAVLLVLIVIAAGMTSRDFRAREHTNWIRNGQMGFALAIQGEQRLDVLGEHVLEFFAKYLGARIGAVYVAESKRRFKRAASYASAVEPAEELQAGDGLLGQVLKERRGVVVRDVPPGYLTIRSSTGRAGPTELLLCPASVDGVIYAVIELGFFRRVTAGDEELAALLSESLGVAVRASQDRTRLEELLEETQRQAEEMQTQQEELRVSNEELEEQGQALKRAQVMQEAQQAELEQTNSQLEEQMQILETQRNALSKSERETSEKARELEKANQHKSEFLANMSHELRTPLNSTLILSKLLQDNKTGNLNEQQVKFAQTIHSAGNDLLVLINDILDLSKIEAGKVELQPEPVPVARTVEATVSSFEAAAQQKGLALSLEVDASTPAQMETDAQRLGQILKNLLSNAMKFTEKGGVGVRVSLADGMVAFAVRDSGIGIAEHQQEFIFEAFRQADGSTHRKYGGTGLGLSISRDLARLLGGDLVVESEVGRGSTFTLRLPLVYAGPAVVQVRPAVPAAASAPVTVAAPVQDTPAAESPRPAPVVYERSVLVVEDDVPFASILRDLAAERDFHCWVTHTATEGYAAAVLHQPSAILLDVNLPDQSGLGVLDQLKHNPLTRHIPVHILSVEDYTRVALERGAVGYALKPVKREQLIDAFQRLESAFSSRLRKVLVVEDDARQRDSIVALLATDSVEITEAANAQAALALLTQQSFDCVVMDLNLPDLSGYELLEQMSGREGMPFPPVIVYTGRSLTGEEEQKLRRFSKSIIIKDARSPERLLDEVTLFIHQVESSLPADRQRMLKMARNRDAVLEGRRILIVEDDVRNIFALSSALEPKGAAIDIARNGREAIARLARMAAGTAERIDLVLMDLMMPEMDGLTAMREIRKRPEWAKLPIVALTAKAMKNDREDALAAGANDYIAKPLDIDKLMSLIRVWMPKGA